MNESVFLLNLCAVFFRCRCSHGMWILVNAISMGFEKVFRSFASIIIQYFNQLISRISLWCDIGFSFFSSRYSFVVVSRFGTSRNFFRNCKFFPMIASLLLNRTKTDLIECIRMLAANEYQYEVKSHISRPSFDSRLNIAIAMRMDTKSKGIVSGTTPLFIESDRKSVRKTFYRSGKSFTWKIEHESETCSCCFCLSRRLSCRFFCYSVSSCAIRCSFVIIVFILILNK